MFVGMAIGRDEFCPIPMVLSQKTSNGRRLVGPSSISDGRVDKPNQNPMLVSRIRDKEEDCLVDELKWVGTCVMLCFA